VQLALIKNESLLDNYVREAAAFLNWAIGATGINLNEKLGNWWCNWHQ
jgi:hypothetical protein